MKKEIGTLYGIGVGPGDPELIPIKSARILEKVDVIFTASSTKNDYSLAVRIAEPHIPSNTAVKMLPFPMTNDLEEKEAAWKDHAQTIMRELQEGKDVAFLTLGDPMTYSTYGYVLKHVKAANGNFPIVTVPGITSYQAAAAGTNTPLVEGEESLVILSGVKGGTHLRKLSNGAGNGPENVVFLKAYKNVKDINLALEERDMLDTSIGVSNCSFANQEVTYDLREFNSKPPKYWTLIIAKKNANNT